METRLTVANTTMINPNANASQDIGPVSYAVPECGTEIVVDLRFLTRPV